MFLRDHNYCLSDCCVSFRGVCVQSGRAGFSPTRPASAARPFHPPHWWKFGEARRGCGTQYWCRSRSEAAPLKYHCQVSGGFVEPAEATNRTDAPTLTVRLVGCRVNPGSWVKAQDDVTSAQTPPMSTVNLIPRVLWRVPALGCWLDPCSHWYKGRRGRQVRGFLGYSGISESGGEPRALQTLRVLAPF